MTVSEALTEGKRRLQSPSPSSNIDTPSLDAALLLAEVLHIRREEIALLGENPVTEEDRALFIRLLERRRSGECIAYILGRREFGGLVFTVNTSVLVPRPDTETLLEAALCDINSTAEPERHLSVLDLCTGCGALAIALKSEKPSLAVTASDISPEALETAELNAMRLLGCQPPGHEGEIIRFINSDIFENISESFNIIVSNPPYIPTGELASLAPEVKQEPRLALDGGADGLDYIRKIISQAPGHLLPDGVLLLEADGGQMPAIRRLLEGRGFCEIKNQKDLGGKERVISAKFGGIE
jgi:release factor glutamine methyltransferase